MVTYKGDEYDMGELGKLPEGMYRIISERTEHYDDKFIPAGPAISRDGLREVIESRGIDPKKAEIIKDFLTDSKFRYSFDGGGEKTEKGVIA